MDFMFRNFYERLNEIRDYHRRYPSNDVTEAEDDEEALKYEPPVEFSGEEAYGKYLDLHEHYNSFINKQFGEQIEYAEYLTSLLEFENIPRKSKYRKEYRSRFFRFNLKNTICLQRIRRWLVGIFGIFLQKDTSIGLPRQTIHQGDTSHGYVFADWSIVG